VGAAAFLLGGGIGFNMRHNSIASDAMTSTEIVFADGSRRTVGPSGTKDDTELFWACRGGGGGNFGINTSFTMKTFDAPDITVFHVAWDDVSDSFAWNLTGALNGCPREFGSRISFQANNGKVKADLLGQFIGSRDFVDRLLRPFVTALPPSENEVEQDDYWTGQKFLSEDQPPIFYQERSAYVSGVLDRRAFDAALKAVRNAPAVTGPVDVRFFQTGGAINDHAADETAFVHRKGDWLMVVGLYWWWDDEFNRPLMKRAHAWQEGLYAELLPATVGGSYQNFTDPSLTKWQDAYYGANYPRLQKVKKTVDPSDAFRFTQGIQPA
jgi:FAD/FMN-containing dehydrogenase